MPHPLLVLLALTAAAGAAAADAASTATEPSQVPPITYTLPDAAQVSLLITRPDGSVARELLHASPRTAGAHSESWDGLDEQGKPVAPGAYAWKLLSTHGLTAEYITTIGLSATPRFASWPGNHGAVAGVAADDSGVYLATGCGEGTILALKQTLDGSKRLWTIPQWLEAWCGPTSMASDGTTLYMLELSGKLYRTPCDKAAATAPWDLAMPGDRDASVFHEVSHIMDLDVGGGQVVISYARQNLVRWIDPKTGKELATVSVPRPYGVAIDPADGSVLVISEGQVLRLKQGSPTPQVVVPKGQLTGAWRMRVDPHSGDILVAENWQNFHWTEWQYFAPDHLDPRSERAQHIYHARGVGYLKDPVPAGGNQIKRFSRTGALVKSYGSPQGRTQGPHVPTDFSNLCAIACTSDGGFIASEEGLTKRTTRFDAQGKVLNEWFGGWAYGQYAVCDPADPTVVWITDRSRFIKTTLDVAHKTWHYVASYECPAMASWFDQDGPVWRIVHHDGSTFFALIGWQGTRGPCLIRLDEAHNRMEMCVASGADLGQDLELHVAACAEPLFPQFLTTTNAAHVNHSWNWSDMDGDGLPQIGEITASRWMGHVNGWYMADDFTWYFHSQNDQLTDVSIYVMKPVSWTKGGIPVYRFPQGANDEACHVFVKDPGFSESVYVDAKGSVYASFNHATSHDHNFGLGGWSGRASMNRVARFDADGTPRWIVGHHAPGSGAAPGEGHYLVRILGTDHDCVVVNDMEYGFAHVWDHDGLWVGRLLEHPVVTPDSPLSAYELCGENFGGSLMPGATSDESFFIGGGINASPVYRITGWDAFKRQAGTLTITPACAATLVAHVQAEAQRSDIAHFAFFEQEHMKLDGTLAKWAAVKPLVITDGAREVAKVYLGWSTSFLYAAFDVTTTSPWANASPMTLAFQGGAAVDLSFGPLGERAKAGPGDERVVAAAIQGKTQVMEFLPVLPKDISPPHYTTHTAFKTQVGEVVFDRAGVMLIDGTNAVVTLKPDHSGYIVEMRAYRHMGHDFAPGYRFRFDASVILADPNGAKSILRIPWHSRASEDSMTNDTFTEAVLRPANWGLAILE